jgi:hypothetical protein
MHSASGEIKSIEAQYARAVRTDAAAGKSCRNQRSPFDDWLEAPLN